MFLNIIRYRIVAKIRYLIRGNLVLFLCQAIIRQLIRFVKKQQEYYHFVNSKTDICIEGYPRSANTLIVYLLLKLRPELRIGHHLHSIVNLKLAIKKKVPTYILIRNPLDAISSLVLFWNYHICENNEKHIIYAIEDYKQFYEYVLKNHQNFEIFNFNDVIDNPEKIIKRISSNLNLYISNNENIEKVKEEVLQSIKARGVDYKASQIPDERRHKYKDEIKIILKMNFLEEINELQKLFNKIRTKT